MAKPLKKSDEGKAKVNSMKRGMMFPISNRHRHFSSVITMIDWC